MFKEKWYLFTQTYIFVVSVEKARISLLVFFDLRNLSLSTLSKKLRVFDFPWCIVVWYGGFYQKFILCLSIIVCVLLLRGQSVLLEKLKVSIFIYLEIANCLEDRLGCNPFYRTVSCVVYPELLCCCAIWIFDHNKVFCDQAFDFLRLHRKMKLLFCFLCAKDGLILIQQGRFGKNAI